MTATPRTITFDCADPAAQVRFWSGVTGRPVDTLPEGTPAQFVGAIGMWPRSNDLAYLFLAVPEGKTAKNRMHLDLECADRSAEVERLVALDDRPIDLIDRLRPGRQRVDERRLSEALAAFAARRPATVCAGRKRQHRGGTQCQAREKSASFHGVRSLRIALRPGSAMIDLGLF